MHQSVNQSTQHVSRPNPPKGKTNRTDAVERKDSNYIPQTKRFARQRKICVRTPLANRQTRLDRKKTDGKKKKKKHTTKEKKESNVAELIQRQKKSTSCGMNSTPKGDQETRRNPYTFPNNPPPHDPAPPTLPNFYIYIFISNTNTPV